jgi:hypothetical protein
MYIKTTEDNNLKADKETCPDGVERYPIGGVRINHLLFQSPDRRAPRCDDGEDEKKK